MVPPFFTGEAVECMAGMTAARILYEYVHSIEVFIILFSHYALAKLKSVLNSLKRMRPFTRRCSIAEVSEAI